MSKLQKLIQELCPDGVEYKTLGEIATIKNGRDYKHLGKGNVPVYGSGGIMTYVDTYVYNKPTVLIPRKGSLGNLFYVDTPFWNVDTIFYTEVDTQQIDVKYLYYLLAKEHLENLNKAGGVPSLTQSILNKIILPVPPLEVQNEIVRILDHFTDLAAEMQAELQAELQARKEQYEYYRNQLLTFNKIGGGTQNVTWMKMSDVYDMKAGKNILASEIYSSETTITPYPCYGGNGKRGYVAVFNQHGEKVLVGRQGALCGNVCFAEGEFYATEHAVVVSEKGFCLPRYTFHVLNMMNLNQYKTAGAQPGLSVTRLETLLVPIPPLTEQERIVTILDKFDALVNDLTQGLPAEIAAVQEQYEYYRNKILSFPRIKIGA